MISYRRARDENGEGTEMKIHMPSEAVFWTALVLIFLALFGHFVPSSAFLNQYQFWIAVASSVVVLLGCVT
jgi:hypothetical protein